MKDELLQQLRDLRTSAAWDHVRGKAYVQAQNAASVVLAKDLVDQKAVIDATRAQERANVLNEFFGLDGSTSFLDELIKDLALDVQIEGEAGTK